MKKGILIQNKHNKNDMYMIAYHEKEFRGKARIRPYLLVSLKTGEVLESYKQLNHIRTGILARDSIVPFDDNYDMYDVENKEIYDMIKERNKNDSGKRYSLSEVKSALRGGKNVIPTIIAKYLSFPNDNFTIEERIAYLIKSLDGDSYYMYDSLPYERKVTKELGEAVYEELEDGKWSYKDVFEWYKIWTCC